MLVSFSVTLIQVRVIWEEGIPIGKKNASIKLAHTQVCGSIFLTNDWWRRVQPMVGGITCWAGGLELYKK